MGQMMFQKKQNVLVEKARVGGARALVLTGLVALTGLVSACQAPDRWCEALDPTPTQTTVATLDAGNYVWALPADFPRPQVPADNPMTVEKVDLGRHLFYDKRLSADGSMSCASCHD